MKELKTDMEKRTMNQAQFEESSLYENQPT